MPSPSAQIHEPACAGVAPAACAALKTITTELVSPTSTATNPAATEETEKSLSTRIEKENRKEMGTD